VNRFAKLLLVLMLLALPLRGMAAVVASLCSPSPGAAAHSQHECCAEGETHAPAIPADQGGTAEGTCSHCATCTAGSAAVADVPAVLPAPVGASPVPFLELRPLGHVPEQLDRPPLAS
jgi:hypothetical protein